MVVVDACGRSCPEPVVMTKKALASKDAAYQILVDNTTALANVTRFANYSGYKVAVEENDDVFTLNLTLGA
ncbi:MAG: sulfurtransferase TusA family protein [Eubacteriales bacterium]